MQIVPVRLKQNSYQIVVGTGILGRLGSALRPLNLGKDAVVITNPVVRRLHGPAVIQGLKKGGYSVTVIDVPDGEKSKSAQSAFALLQKVAAYDVQKKIFIVALGGGVIGDLVGFVASVYKRGVPYIHVPTTLLAQIDSAIGGKVAIDLPVGKNLVGSFYQPKIVWSDVSVLATLNARQIRNGLAEAVKYGVISDPQFFDYLTRNHPAILARDPQALEAVVTACSRIKASVVMKDERETKGIRTILNFGHTVGHAVETAAGYRYYHHGEAVALGMRVAAELSLKKGLLDRQSVRRIEAVLTDIGLPSRIEKVSLPKILAAMRHDKKFIGKRNRFVLATRIGRVTVVENLSEALISQAIRSRM